MLFVKRPFSHPSPLPSHPYRKHRFQIVFCNGAEGEVCFCCLSFLINKTSVIIIPVYVGMIGFYRRGLLGQNGRFAPVTSYSSKPRLTGASTSNRFIVGTSSPTVSSCTSPIQTVPASFSATPKVIKNALSGTSSTSSYGVHS